MFSQVLCAVAPCRGHDPPPAQDMKVYLEVTDLLWSIDKKEDPWNLTPEIGTVIKGGPNYEKGMIVAPDTSQMENRYDANELVTHWHVAWERDRTIDSSQRSVSIPISSFVVASSGHALAASMALVKGLGAAKWGEQFQKSDFNCEQAVRERFEMGYFHVD